MTRPSKLAKASAREVNLAALEAWEQRQVARGRSQCAADWVDGLAARLGRPDMPASLAGMSEDDLKAVYERLRRGAQ